MPHFYIERIPSGIRYRRTVYSEEAQSHLSPQTRVFEQTANASLPQLNTARAHVIPTSFLTLSTPGKRPVEEFAAHHIDEDPYSGEHGRGIFVPHASGLEPERKYRRILSTGPRTAARDDWGSSRSALQPSPPVEPPVQYEPFDDCLPLLKVNVEVLVDGNLARTTLLQQFSNTSKQAIKDARHTFPLYDGAVVVAFKCVIGNEKELVGKVQAKDEARRQFKKAIEKQETAGLLEEHTPEIFETLVGNIPGETNISVHIEYIHEIKAAILDSGEHVLELSIPMSIAPRYGGLASDTGVGMSSSTMEEDGLNIIVKVCDSSKVKKLHCNRHVTLQQNIPVQLTKVSNFSKLGGGGEESTTWNSTPLTQTIANYSSTTSIMDEDFIVSIEHHSSNHIRSRAVLSPAGEDGLSALMVSLKPSEIFKDAVQADKFEGDIIFLLDRSGSMGFGPASSSREISSGRPAASKMSTLVDSMLVSLASLPESCRFNIVSFGSDTEFMWNTSKPYTEETLQSAREYTRKMAADFGGTNLSYALEQVVGSVKDVAVSTQIIVITDGEVEPEAALLSVWEARQKFGDRIRFFALGIGHNVPHRLINRIGEFGGGYGEVIDIKEKPDWTDRLILVLSSGIMPNTWTCEIDLGTGFKRQSLYSCPFGSGLSVHPEAGGSEPAFVSFVQGPHPMPALHPFSFRSTFLLLDMNLDNYPTQVLVRATTDHAKARSERVLAVERTTVDQSCIQHLAVKAVLLGMEEEMRRQYFTRSQEDIGRENAVRLGTKYSITSHWTSFVATEGSTAAADDIELYRATFRQGNFKDFFSSQPLPAAQADFGSRLMFGSLESGGHNQVSSAQATSLAMPRPAAWDSVSSLPAPNPRQSWQPRHSGPVHEHPPRRTTNVDPPEWLEIEPAFMGKPTDFSKSSYLPDYFEADGAGRSLRQVENNELLIYGSSQASGHTSEPGSNDGNLDHPIRVDIDQYGLDKRMQIRRRNNATHSARRQITWAQVAKLQRAHGLLEIDKEFREMLSDHYLENTAEKVTQSLLGTFHSFKTMPKDNHRLIVDTIMIIHYFQTHLAIDKDIWTMMIDKAELAVLKELRAQEPDDLTNTVAILDLAAMHKHLDNHMKDIEPESCMFLTSEQNSCVFCHKLGLLKSFHEASGGFQNLITTAFKCIDEGCDFTATGGGRFRQVWEHMVSSGHLCRQG